jgi:hypothetical protein
MTRLELNTYVDTQVTNKTAANSLTPINEGNAIKSVADYVDQQDLLKENVANKSINVSSDGLSDLKYPSVKSVKDYTDGLVVGLLDDRGNYNASVNTFPASGGSGVSGAILKGDLWFISVAGTLGGVSVPVGASVRALVDSPVQINANWNVLNVGLGYTPENVVNKSLDVVIDATSDVKYPSVKAVKTYVDANAGGTSVFKVLKTVITNAELLNIFLNPKTIGPAIVGKIIIPTHIIIKINFNTTQYSDPGGSWKVRFGSTSSSLSTITSYIAAATNDQEVLHTVFYPQISNSSSFSNTPILLTTTANNPIGGDSGVTVYLSYTEITL